MPALAQNNDTAEVLRRYFETESPFQDTQNKKHEFPDAFALISLEAYGKRQSTMILCVSADKGWRSFCEQSDHLVCLDDIDTALSYFNEAGRVVAENIMALLRSGETRSLVDAVESALEYRLSDNDFDADGWSGVEFETEPLSAAAQSIDWESASPPIVIAANEDSVTFTTTLQVLVSFEANFQFSVRDGIDRDYVSLGSEHVYTEETVEFELALTVSRSIDPAVEVLEADVAWKSIEVNFGIVEPFQNENPYDEKY